MLDLAVNQNIIDKSGAWFSYSGERIGQGRENARTFLREHPEVAAEIDRKVRLGFGLPVVGGAVEAATATPAPKEEKKAKA
jgi:recombination protein RecA